MADATDVFTRLREREQARLSVLEQRKAEQQSTKRVEETSKYFIEQLEVKSNVVTRMLEEAEGLSKAELPSHFKKVSSECQNLQKFVSDSIDFLNSRDKKASQEQITDLLQLVASKQSQLLPQKKFAFSSRTKKAAPKPESEVKVQSEVRVHNEVDGKVSSVSVNSKVIKDKKGVKLEMMAAEVKGRDVHLSHLEDCEVRLFGAPSTIHLTDISSCTVQSGPVSGSIFVENCADCSFVVACQQLRVHSTSSSHFYLHVTSRAVIEDSRQLAFAPYSRTYPELLADYEDAGLDRNMNNWDKVDDFDWLASHEPSPNWTVLPENKRTEFL